MRGTIAIVLTLMGLLVAASVFAYRTWHDMGEVEISLHGLIAMGLGIGLTLLLGVGLMSLVFFSARRGYDDEAGHD